MDVRELILEYLYNIPPCPYALLRVIFTRDEYQGKATILQHIHMVEYLKLEELNEDQIRKLNDLVRSSVCDIVGIDKV